jgi:KRAB domain-containing zinc finger protein
MKRHIFSKHKSDAERDHKCEFCGKGFLTKNHLKDHRNVHTGEKPYMCDFCGSTFAGEGNWRNHVKAVHFGEKVRIRDKKKMKKMDT